MAGYRGGCMCGAVRYELRSKPELSGWCHCTTCQKLSGSPGMVFASLPRADFAYVKGADLVKPLILTSFAQRAFCGDCGSPLTITYDFQPETIDFAVCTLDDPGIAPPETHIFWASKPSWLTIEDGLPKYDRFRPGTARLEGTEPPDAS
jgi:hypothetical protein